MAHNPIGESFLTSNLDLITTLALGSRPGQGLAKVWAKSESLKVIFHALESVGKCERMNPHIPK